MLIPPGVAHKQLEANGGFTLLGAYPTQEFDGSIDTLTGSPTAEQRDWIKMFCAFDGTNYGAGCKVSVQHATAQLNANTINCHFCYIVDKHIKSTHVVFHPI